MKSTYLKNILSATTVSLVVGLSSASASAGGMEETFVHLGSAETTSVRVVYRASDLSTEEGRAKLRHSIAGAARFVCGPSNLREAGSLKIATRNRECYQHSVAAAHSQVQGGEFAALFVTQ